MKYYTHGHAGRAESSHGFSNRFHACYWYLSMFSSRIILMCVSTCDRYALFLCAYIISCCFQHAWVESWLVPVHIYLPRSAYKRFFLYYTHTSYICVNVCVCISGSRKINNTVKKSNQIYSGENCSAIKSPYYTTYSNGKVRMTVWRFFEIFPEHCHRTADNQSRLTVFAKPFRIIFSIDLKITTL